jgi:hypothetical protein
MATFDEILGYIFANWKNYYKSIFGNTKNAIRWYYESQNTLRWKWHLYLEYGIRIYE